MIVGVLNYDSPNSLGQANCLLYVCSMEYVNVFNGPISVLCDNIVDGRSHSVGNIFEDDKVKIGEPSTSNKVLKDQMLSILASWTLGDNITGVCVKWNIPKVN